MCDTILKDHIRLQPSPFFFVYLIFLFLFPPFLPNTGSTCFAACRTRSKSIAGWARQTDILNTPVYSGAFSWVCLHQRRFDRLGWRVSTDCTHSERERERERAQGVLCSEPASPACHGLRQTERERERESKHGQQRGRHTVRAGQATTAHSDTGEAGGE